MNKKQRKKPRSPGKPQWFKQDPRDKRQLILKNGTRLRQPVVGLGLYMSQGMNVYGLSRKGLRQLHINFWKKNTYGKRNRTGTAQGQNYPYVNYQGRTYRIHQLMARAWLGGIPDGFVADHINGDIDDSRLVNIRVISIPENNRCGGILKRLRNIAKERNDPSSLPVNIDNADLLEIFERTRGVTGRKLDKLFSKEVERYLVKVNVH